MGGFVFHPDNHRADVPINFNASYHSEKVKYTRKH